MLSLILGKTNVLLILLWMENWSRSIPNSTQRWAMVCEEALGSSPCFPITSRLPCFSTSTPRVMRTYSSRVSGYLPLGKWCAKCQPVKSNPAAHLLGARTDRPGVAEHLALFTFWCAFCTGTTFMRRQHTVSLMTSRFSAGLPHAKICTRI